MEAKLNGVCRGDGLIYAKVALSGVASTDGLSVGALADDGTELPCNWRALGETGATEGGMCTIALTLPLLTAGSIALRIAAGGDEAALKLSMERAKWESRFNYRFRPALAREIRGTDEGNPYQNINIDFHRLTPDRDELILRGTLWMPAQLGAEMEVSCFSEAGRAIGTPPITLGDAVRPSDFDPDFLIRTWDFSVRLPRALTSFTLLAHGKGDPERRVFRTVEPGFFDELLGRGTFPCENASSDPRYDSYFRARRATPGLVEQQRGRAFSHDVMFSVVVPLFRTPPALFAEMVASVEGQSYQNWELVLVNASPEDGQLAQAVADACTRDRRIRCVTLEENRGIAANTHAGLKACTGDFTCFLDHDDVLEPDALFEYACALESHPETDLLYCDEDKLDERGAYVEPYFKPDFDPFLLRCYNYVAHFLCVRASLLDKLGPTGSEYDGAQDHDLTLRVSERTRNVYHVRRVLYHWRITQSSTAKAGSGAKTYAEDAGGRAIRAHLDRLRIPAEVQDAPMPFIHRVKYLVQGDPLVSIVIPNKDCADMLTACVRSILDKTRYRNYEIVIVDNNSTEPETPACYERLQALDARVRTVSWPDEFNFSKIVNFGVAQAEGDYLVLLNNDTEVIDPEWLENMLGICQQDEVGVVGARLLYADGTVQHAGVMLPDYWTPAKEAYRDVPDSNTGYFHQGALTHAFSIVTAACCMTKRAVFDQVGGFDEQLAVAYNDVDFCLKVREAGLLVIYEPTAKLYHYESVSRGWDGGTPEKRIRSLVEESRLRGRWAAYYVKGDPYYNPNLATGWYKLAP